MKNIFGKKSFFVFLLIIFLLNLFVLPQIAVAENLEEMKPEEINKYLQLPDKGAQKLMDSLNKFLTNKKVNLISSENPDPRETAANEILRTGAKIQVLNSLLIDAPVEVVGKIVKCAIDIAQIILAKNISKEFWEKLEKETVSKAVEVGMKALMENEIKITPGALKYSYTSYKGNKQEVILQYLIIYKSTGINQGNVEIRFYSPVTIEPPPPFRGWVLTGTYHELEGDLQPFIVEISGSVKDYKWDGDPTIEITFPESVPDLGIRPMGFWDRHLINPIKEELKETSFVFQKISGKTSKVKEEIQSFGENAVSNIEDALKGIKNKIEGAWQKFEETVSEFNFLAAVGLSSNVNRKIALESSLEKTEGELESLRKEISLLEEKLKNEEGLRAEEKEKYESEISELTEKVDSLADMVDDFNTKISGLSAREKTTQETENPEAKETEEAGQEIIICQKREGDLLKKNKIIFNEIAWMGTENSANDEWFELKNISGTEIDLEGWQILDKDGQIKIIFSSGERFSANSFYLLERTDDNSVPNIKADKIYTGSLNDTNEALYLFNKNCQLEDEVLASLDWPAGDKTSKRTMERKSDFSWQTSSNIGGTPKSQNSSGYFFTSSSGSGGGSSTSGGTSGGSSSGGSGGGNQSSSPPSPPPPKFGILINEIQLEGQTSKDEFVELFNSLNEEVDLASFSLKKKTSSGSESSLVSSDKFSGKIPPKGYFLIAPQPNSDGTPNYQGDAPADLFYSGKTYSIAANNAILLYDSNNNLIDKVGFGQAKDFEGNVFPENSKKGQSLGRKWIETDQKSQDTDNNQNDFEIQIPTPKAKNETFVAMPSQSNLEILPNAIEFSVDFGKNPQSQILTLDSDTILNWQASIEYTSPSSDGINWLRIIPNSGKTPSQILVSAFVSDLTPGEYQAFLNIESEAQNSPLKIPVSLKLISEDFTFADHLIISEAQLADNEFVELYNPTDEDISLAGWYLSYFSKDDNWDKPQRNWGFPTSTIPSKSHYLIGILGYPDVDWQVLTQDGKPYSTGQLSKYAGSLAIFSCNPKYDEKENPISVEEAMACKIDALGWGEAIVKEGEVANPAPAGKSLARKLKINQKGELNYIDTDNNQFDFEIEEISPKNLNSHSFSDLDKDGILDLFDEETVITENGSLEVGEYEFRNLIIKEGVEVVLNSDPSIEGIKGVKINAKNLNLEEGATILADGKGYKAKEGPGAGKVITTGGGSCSGYSFVSIGSGGSYGGIGGKGSYPSCGGEVEGGSSYGFLELPIDLGSGGGNENGGAGGGEIVIDVVEKINLAGQISANGQDGEGRSYSNSGGGSGGGILISTNVLEGTGKILANGGQGYDNLGGGGAGGRIAIYYNLKDGFTGDIQTIGGQGYKSGGAGTIFLKSLEKELGDLIIDNGNFEGFTNLERDLGFDNLRVLNSAHLYLPEKLAINYLEVEGAALESETQTEIEASQINLKENSSIILPAEEFLKIKVNNLVLESESKIISNLDIESEEISLDSTSAILADGKGFSAGQGPGSGKVAMTGGGSCSGYNYIGFGSGGGYGGIGGQGGYSSCYSKIDGGTFYGDLKTPLDFGSGGGGGTAGAGGGAVQIVANNLNLAGQISANGGDGNTLGYGGSGGGSGGSILIKTNVLGGSGQILVDGGKGYSNLGGGGSGGRIAIYYDSKDSFSGDIQAFGDQGFKSGGAGTIFLKSPSQEHGDLIIDNNNSDGATQLAENYTFDNLEVLNSSHLYLPENLTVSDLEIQNNSILESASASNIDAIQLVIADGSSLVGPNQVFVTINADNFSIRTESKIMVNVEIKARNFSIDASSGILADGKGYPGGQGPGAGKEDETGGGGCSGYSYCWFGSGGGYGGQGGEGSYSGCGATVEGGLSYGSEETPIDFGSGGGIQGGAGGGVIKISTTNYLNLDGQISANGEDGQRYSGCGGSGGGSGGSIYITTNIFEGSGQIRADGGQGYDGVGGGGAGGRIAIYSQTNNFQGIVRVEGGAAGYQAGQDGTVYY